jgi:hypothetical protein
MLGLVRFLARFFRPKGRAKGEREESPLAKILNVATCVPIILVPGFRVVGVVALLFHAVPCDFLRKLDYWTVSMACCQLARPWLGNPLSCALSLAIPFAPIAVTAASIASFELHGDPDAEHVAYGLAGLFCFFADGFCSGSYILPAGFLHAAWHCLAAASLRTTQKR